VWIKPASSLVVYLGKAKALNKTPLPQSSFYKSNRWQLDFEDQKDPFAVYWLRYFVTNTVNEQVPSIIGYQLNNFNH